MPKSAGKGIWQACSCLWGWISSLGLQGRTSSNKAHTSLCPALIKMYDHQTADTQNTAHTKEAQGPQLTKLYFLPKLLRQGIWLVGLGFIFWEGHKKLHHVEPGPTSFWMCFKKHLKYQGCQDNNWKRFISFSDLMIFLQSRLCKIPHKHWPSFLLFPIFVADGNIHTNLKDLHLEKKYNHLIIQVSLQWCLRF